MASILHIEDVEWTKPKRFQRDIFLNDEEMIFVAFKGINLALLILFLVNLEVIWFILGRYKKNQWRDALDGKSFAAMVEENENSWSLKRTSIVKWKMRKFPATFIIETSQGETLHLIIPRFSDFKLFFKLFIEENNWPDLDEANPNPA